MAEGVGGDAAEDLVAARLVGVDGLVEHRCVDPAWGYGVHADAIAAVVGDEGTLDAEHSTLGSGVRHNLLHAHERRHRRDEDDAATTAGHHATQHFATQGKDAEDVGIDDAEILRVGDVESGLLEVDTCTIHEDVDGTDVLFDVGHKSGHSSLVGDVEGTIGALRAQLLLGFAQFLFTTANDDHFGASLHKDAGDAEAKACAASSDDGHLAVEGELR